MLHFPYTMAHTKKFWITGPFPPHKIFFEPKTVREDTAVKILLEEKVFTK